MRKIYILLSALVVAAVSAWAQPEKNSFLTSDAYKENPRFYLSNLNPMYFGSNVLIDRVISTESLADYNGTTKIGTCNLAKWTELYEAVKYAHNDTSYLSPSIIFDSLVGLYQKYDKVFPIAILNVEYSRLKKEVINGTIGYDLSLRETNRVLLEKRGYRISALNSDVFNLMASTVLSDIISGDKVRFVVPDVLEFRSNKKLDGTTISLRIDFGDGNGLRPVKFEEIVEVSYGSSSGGKTMKIEVLSTKPPSGRSGSQTISVSTSRSTFLFKGTSTVPRSSNARISVGNNTPDVLEHDANILFPIAKYVGWKKRPYYCVPSKLRLCWAEQLEEQPKLECTVYLAPSNPSPKLRKPFVIVDGFDPGDKRNFLRTDIKLDADMPKDNDARGIFELLNGNPSPWYTGINASPQLVYKLQDMGYDIIILNWLDGAGDITVNGELLRRFLKEYLNGNAMRDINTEEIILVGPSMGGLITRYALSTMEKAGESHNVKTWISFDAPHQGANIPIGLQNTISVFKDIGTGKKQMDIIEVTMPILGGIIKHFTEEITDKLADSKSKFQESVNKLNTPAARQLLLKHFTNLDRCPESTTLYNQLDELGYPSNSKNYAITNGGTTKLYEGEGRQIVAFATSLPWMYSYCSSLPNADGSFQISNVSRQRFRQTVTFTGPCIGLDNAVGGWNSALYSLNCNKGNTYRIPDTDISHTRASFIPTASAFGQRVTKDNVYKKWEEYILNRADGSNTTYFDQIQGAVGDCEEHVTISPNLAVYLLGKLKEDNYNITRPMVREGKVSNLTLNNVTLRAKESITLAGNGNTVSIPSEYSITLPRIFGSDRRITVPESKAIIEAGNSITLLPGFTASGDATIKISPPAAFLRELAGQRAFSEVIDYTIPSPYLNEVWDYSDPSNPRLVSAIDDKNSDAGRHLQISPNPTTDKAVVQFASSDMSPIAYQLINSNGAIVYNGNCMGDLSIELDLKHYPSGLYLFKMTQGNKVYTEKIIKR